MKLTQADAGWTHCHPCSPWQGHRSHHNTGSRKENNFASPAQTLLCPPALLLPLCLLDLPLAPKQGGCKFSGAGCYRLDCICLGINNLLLDGQSEFN